MIMKLKKGLSIILAGTMFVLSACSTGSSESDMQSSAEDGGTSEAEPVKIEVFLAESSNNWKGISVVQYIEDKFNVEFDFIGPSWGDQETQLNMQVAGGDISDLVFASYEYDEPILQEYMEDGVMLELTDLLPNYPNLVNYIDSDETFDYINLVEGKTYALPRFFSRYSEHGLYIRKDILDELGLSIPQTMDEFYEVMSKAVEADLDSNGMIGLTVNNAWWMQHLTIQFTGANSWSLEGDRYVEYYTTEKYKEALKWFNKLYVEGLLDPDFVLNKEANAMEKLMSGRAFAGNASCTPQNYAKTVDGLKSNNAEAELVLIPYPEGTSGQFVRGGTASLLGVNFISPSAKNPEKILEILDWMVSEEGRHIVKYGIEGVHYTMNGDEMVINQEAFDADTQASPDAWTEGICIISKMADFIGSASVSPTVDYAEELSEAMEVRNATEIVSEMYTYGFQSENYSDFITNVEDTQAEWFAAFVTGTSDIDTQWEEYLKALDDSGYGKIEEDLNVWMNEHAK